MQKTGTRKIAALAFATTALPVTETRLHCQQRTRRVATDQERAVDTAVGT
jgi:hypothetical protein